jgi:hypothetical protein
MDTVHPGLGNTRKAMLMGNGLAIRSTLPDPQHGDVRPHPNRDRLFTSDRVLL